MDAEESNEEEEEEGEEEGAEFEEMPSDVDTSDDDSDEEGVPLRLTTCTTTRQLAKDVITDGSTLISCDQSSIRGP